MPFLIAAVILLTALCALNLVLTLAVIRRLRETTEQLETMTGARPPLLANGTPVPQVAGAPERPVLVGFFDTDCKACPAQLPHFVERAAAHDPSRVLAVISGAGGDTYLEALGPVATVITEPTRGPVCAAYDVSVFPSFYLVDGDGRISSGDVNVTRLEAPVNA